MTVITKKVVIENEEFVLIKDNSANGVYYGTIPYSELDENGKLKRQLNGYDMAIVLLSDSVERNESPLVSAIKERQRRIPLDRFITEGHTKEEIIQFILAM
jgi:hypothetical protein